MWTAVCAGQFSETIKYALLLCRAQAAASLTTTKTCDGLLLLAVFVWLLWGSVAACVVTNLLIVWLHVSRHQPWHPAPPLCH
jgi:hypothetical protein